MTDKKPFFAQLREKITNENGDIDVSDLMNDENKFNAEKYEFLTADPPKRSPGPCGGPSGGFGSSSKSKLVDMASIVAYELTEAQIKYVEEQFEEKGPMSQQEFNHLLMNYTFEENEKDFKSISEICPQLQDGKLSKEVMVNIGEFTTSLAKEIDSIGDSEWNREKLRKWTEEVRQCYTKQLASFIRSVVKQCGTEFLTNAVYDLFGTAGLFIVGGLYYFNNKDKSVKNIPKMPNAIEKAGAESIPPVAQRWYEDTITSDAWNNLHSSGDNIA